MISHRRSESAAYEFTIVGMLGPVLTGALRPCVVAPPEFQTIMRAGIPEGGDLAELVLWLDSRGLLIADILELT